MRGIWLALMLVLMAVLLEWNGCAGPRLPRPSWRIANPDFLSCCR